MMMMMMMISVEKTLEIDVLYFCLVKCASLIKPLNK
jgi:hypothetical protein